MMDVVLFDEATPVAKSIASSVIICKKVEEMPSL